MTRIASLAFFLAVAVSAAAMALSFDAGDWYFRVAARPDWSPPPWLFGPAWAVAWVALALAGWLAWESGRPGRGRALAGWVALLGLSAAWSWLMFGVHRPGWAWLELGAVLIAAVLCLGWFRPLSGRAALLLLPFIAWTGFLWAWSLALWTVNGGALGRFLQ